jgi:phosphatidylglycerol lysyltransferase
MTAVAQIKRLGPVLVGVLLLLAGYALYHATRQYHYDEVVSHLAALPRESVWLAITLTFLSYGVLTLYDFFGLVYVGKRLPYARIALASFVGYVFSYNVGLSVLGGGAVRYRLYSGWGLSTADIARIIGFAALTFWSGCFLLAGVSLIIEPVRLPVVLHTSIVSTLPLGVVLLTVVLAYVAWAAIWRRPLVFRAIEIAPPKRRLVAGQLVLSSLDCLVAASVMYTLLPQSDQLTFVAFIGAYLLAMVAGLVSHVPGGLGVFEAVLLAFLEPHIPGAQVLGALVAYRVIYYILPFVAGAAALGVHELALRNKLLVTAFQISSRWVPEVLPRVLAVATFLGGAILLASGATPTLDDRLRWLDALVPLPIVEMSHLVGSLAGLSLLVLARGLQKRLDSAYVLTLALLPIGIIVSLLKGFDYEEALALGVMFVALLPCRKHFYRKGSLLAEPLNPEWLVAAVLVVAGSIWIGFFSYKHVEYSDDLWWEFTLQGDAPRFLRATVGVVALGVALAMRQLLRPARFRPIAPTITDLDHAQAVAATDNESLAHLALLGDKQLLFSESGRSFIMYAVEGRSWVALGDPVGLVEERTELAWRFRELADRYGGWAAFYQVSTRTLPLYLELGLTLLKLGEEAHVPLVDFSLDGKERYDLRRAQRLMEKEGARFEIVDPTQVAGLLNELQTISAAWLLEKNTREKGFSLGFFDRAYLSRLPLAVVRREEKVLAFANLWPGGGRRELSVDLMRHRPEAPRAVMDFLFVSLMLWGKEHGYGHFNLGLAPFSGIEARDVAPLWNRMGATLFRYGEYFYNFQGLRQYKEKFTPDWQPRYLASPGLLALPVVITNVAALVSRGLKGLVAR